MGNMLNGCRKGEKSSGQEKDVLKIKRPRVKGPMSRRVAGGASKDRVLKDVNYVFI